MKSMIVIGVILLVVFALLFLSRRVSTTTCYQGGFDDIPSFFQKLMHAQTHNAFLIIQVTDSPDFLQFTAGDEILQMDYPLITDDQKRNARQLSSVCERLGLPSRKNTGTDGSEFLDFDITGTPEEMSLIVQKVFESVFGVSKDQQLTFKGNGLAGNNGSL